MTDIVQLTFDRDYNKWSHGDIAGFSEEAANAILGVRITVTREDEDGAEAKRQFRVAHKTTEAELAAWEKRQSGEGEKGPDLLSIRFSRDCGKYSVGDVAGFVKHVAEQYVRNGDAVWHDDSRTRPDEKMTGLSPLTRSKLIFAGFKTDRSIQGADDKTLRGVRGIGDVALEEIRDVVG